MKSFASLFLVLVLTGCSQSDSPSSTASSPKTKLIQFHRYQVIFTAVKVPNELLKPYMTNSVGPDSIKVRYQIANYLLAHTNEFSFIAPTGNFVPVVTTGHGTGGRFMLNNKQESAELEKTGMKIMGLEMNVEVKDEDDHGYVWYEGMASYNVDVNSTPATGYGGGIPFPGALLPVGQADLQPLYVGTNFTLCALVKFDRAN